MKVLMVCLGNICRSPTAEAVFRAKAQQRGLTIEVDSAGTGGWHAGEPPDGRAIRAGADRGYDLSKQRARPVKTSDFERFDLILAMDEDNYETLLMRAPAELRDRIHLFLSVIGDGPTSVPDPYYGNEDGFDCVLDMVEQASELWLDKIKNRE